jgi:hypothetical protein
MDKVTIEDLLGTSSQKGTGLVCAVERQGLVSATKKEKIMATKNLYGTKFDVPLFVLLIYLSI